MIGRWYKSEMERILGTAIMTETSDDVRATGACLCGAVRYQVRGPLREIIACHCSQCRRMSGHHVAATATARENLEITGRESLTWFRASPDAQRGFCAKCGSTLFWEADARDYTAIYAGSLDAGSGLTLAAHIFVGDKGDYYELTDGLPQFEEYSQNMQVPET
tara:strand:- start:120 stop:608 length:489 start_codon:yes stop_codon:yes gene_type:complete